VKRDDVIVRATSKVVYRQPMMKDRDDEQPRCDRCGFPMQINYQLPAEDDLPAVEGFTCPLCGHTLKREKKS